MAFVSFDEGEVEEKLWHFPDYVYEGVSAFDADRAWIVGYRGLSVDPDLPSGSIRHTDDGGESWISQQLPRDDVALWKVSFVGARR